MDVYVHTELEKHTLVQYTSRKCASHGAWECLKGSLFKTFVNSLDFLRLERLHISQHLLNLNL